MQIWQISMYIMYIIWKHYGYIHNIIAIINVSQIKKIYCTINDNSGVILNNPVLNKHDCYYSSSASSNFFIIYKCRNNASFFYEVITLYLSSSSSSLNEIKQDTPHTLFKSKYMYNLLIRGIYISRLKDTFTYEISSVFNTVVQKMNDQKNQIEYTIKQLNIEYLHLYNILYDYFFFCIWSIMSVLYVIHYKRDKNILLKNHIALYLEL